MPNDDSADGPNSGETMLMELEPKLSMPQADAMVQDIQTHMGKDLDLDASKVESVSTAAIQVLLAAVKSWRTDERSLRLINPSEAFLTTLGRIGLTPETFKSNEATS